MHVIHPRPQQGFKSCVRFIVQNVIFAASVLISSATASAQITSITVTPAAPTVAAMDTVQLSATAVPAAAAFTWSSSAPAIATVDSTGLVTGVKSGTATIFAKDPNGTAAGGVQLTVTKGTLKSIVLSAPVSTVQALGTVQLTATGTFTSPVKGLSHTESVLGDATLKLTPNDTKLATIDQASGILTALAAGAVTITGSYSAAVPVTPAAPGISLNVTAAPSGKQPAPKFTANSPANSNSVTIQVSTANDTVSIRAYPPGTIGGKAGTCDSFDITLGTLLQIVTPAGTASGSGAATPTTTSTSTKVTTAGDTVLTLNQPLVAGQSLCIQETSAADATVTGWNTTPFVVLDPNDYGLFNTYFILGVQATNQQSTTGNSSAGQYLEIGFNNTFRQATTKSDKNCGTDKMSKCNFRPGLAMNLDFRLSPIPVSATATTTSSIASINSISPNQLSSQQSARGVFSVYTPYKLRGFNNNSDFFTLGPVYQGAVGTLINPTGTASSAATTSASGVTQPASITTTNFASGFYSWAFGVRIALDRYVANPDKAPQAIWQSNFTIGEYSNLPSYVCKQLTNQLTNPYASNPVNTSCDQGAYAPVGTSSTTGTPPVTTVGAPWSYYTYSRTIRPRLNFDGILKLPNYPFVLGVDANLQQYTMFRKNNLDVLNKPGDDIRVYFGIQVDLNTFLSKF